MNVWILLYFNLVNTYCLFSRNKILVHLAILYSVRFLSYLGHFPRLKKIMATSKRYVPPLSKSKGSAGAAAESTRRLDDLVQDLIFTVKLGSKDKYSEFNSEKVILQYCYCFTAYINNFDKSQYAVSACYLSIFKFEKATTRNCLHFHESKERYSCSLSCCYPHTFSLS